MTIRLAVYAPLRLFLRTMAVFDRAPLFHNGDLLSAPASDHFNRRENSRRSRADDDNIRFHALPSFKPNRQGYFPHPFSFRSDILQNPYSFSRRTGRKTPSFPSDKDSASSKSALPQRAQPSNIRRLPAAHSRKYSAPLQASRPRSRRDPPDKDVMSHRLRINLGITRDRIAEGRKPTSRSLAEICRKDRIDGQLIPAFIGSHAII